ncbi:MAG: hypothetical protein K8L97_30410 [Anaerolineae bacterium]|nr:hypothetical protein [Anaerolineae bacterium]
MKLFTNRFRRSDLVFLIAAVFSVVLYVRTADGGFPLDDSWIHQVYGRNLAQTGQWAFVPGVPSAASTSPLYTVLLSIGYRLNVPFQLWTHGLGVLALWVSGMVGARLGEKTLTPNPSPSGRGEQITSPHSWPTLRQAQSTTRPLQTGEGKKLKGMRYVGVVSGLAVVLAWHLIWAASSGMETMLFSMWTLVLLYVGSGYQLSVVGYQPLAVSGESTSPPSPLSNLERGRENAAHLIKGAVFGVVAALATVIRPEGIVLAGLIGSTMLIVRPQGTWRGFMLWAVGAMVGFGVVIAPYLALNLQLTGGLLPDTAAAKQAENAPLLAVSYPGRIINMLFPLVAGGQVLLLPGIIYYVIWVLRRLRQDRSALFGLVPLAWALALIALYAARLPAPYQHGRYVIPALPSLIVIGVVGLLVWMRERNTLGDRVITRAVGISAVLGFVYFAFAAGPVVYRQDVRIIDEEMVATAHWIAANIPPNELLAIHDIGAVGYFAPRPIIDLAGLVSPEIVPFITEEEPLWNWMEERDARYLMAFPDQIPGDDVNDPRLCPIFTTGGKTSPAAGGPNMAVYKLAWDGMC